MSKKEKDIKTNAIRLIEAKKIKYILHHYDADDGFTDGISVAHKINMDESRAFKTLVLVGHSRQNYVCVIPVNHELDLKKAAKFFGEKNIEMIHSKELLPLTGYIHGGCSPVGMKKLFRTAIHESAQQYETIGVSGGKIGINIEMAPADLVKLTGAEFADIIKKKDN